MKKILSVIGGFFVKIWRWIKETAWVQPLLIVGIIFGVIFSIPSIVDGVKALNEKNNSAETYYKKYKVSLEGAEKSAADKLMKDIKDNEEGNSTSLAGQKFFLIFISSSCTACQSAREGLEFLQGDGKDLMKGEKLNFKTIFTDEEIDKGKEDWKKEDTLSEDNSATSQFEAFLIRNGLVLDLFAAEAQLTPLFTNNKITEDEINDLSDSSVDKSKFKVPTIIQVDFTANGPGIKEVFIYNETLLAGSTKLDKGRYLANAWFGEGMFGPNYSGN